MRKLLVARSLRLRVRHVEQRVDYGMTSKTISVRLNDGLAAKLDQLATLSGRPRSWLIERMIDDYIDEELRQVAAVREALDDDEAGRSNSRPHDEVMEELDQFLRSKIGDAEFDRLVREEEEELQRMRAG